MKQIATESFSAALSQTYYQGQHIQNRPRRNGPINIFSKWPPFSIFGPINLINKLSVAICFRSNAIFPRLLDGARKNVRCAAISDGKPVSPVCALHSLVSVDIRHVVFETAFCVLFYTALFHHKM